ncbi:MAG: 4-hydroxy-tetrahydrodipicolinate reductase [Longimicrobiales bacterium]|nr:4-hydroxy-tetrahydrodipicolinate reductase [Longimicrobiales bacterium]
MIDVVVSGATGRMGRTLGRLLSGAEGLRAVGGVAPDRPMEGAERIGYPVIVDVADCGPLVREADAIIDFSAPEHLSALLAGAVEELGGKALLVGTTGLPTELESALDALSETAAVLVASNFSVGVNVLLGLAEQAARALPAEGYDVEIIETHHGEKDDAPSGTALSLGEAAARVRGRSLDADRVDGRSGRVGPRPVGEIGFHAVRGGGVAGEHTVRFLGSGEELALSHRAHSRELFADGALVAARWLVGKSPGRYTMKQVLGL